MIPSIPQLSLFVDHALDLAIRYAREHGGLAPMFQVHSQDHIDVISAEEIPDDTPREVAADALCALVRDLVKTRNAYAVVNIVEAWVMDVDKAHPLFHIAQRGDLQELERMGVGKRRECIVVTLETPIYQRIVLQFFYRNANGHLILREKKDSDSGFGRGEGRFFNFFSEEEQTAHA